MTDTAPETTSALDEFTQRIVWLEQQMAEASSPEQRQIYSEMIELTRNRKRCFEIEERSRIKLPPDNRGWTGKPPPSSPEAKPLPARGFIDDAPLGPPAGIRYVDAMCDAQDARDRAELVRQNRQAVIDLFHEAKVADEQQRRAAAEARGFHKAPGDPDFDVR
jgi:hypothetical protein